MSIQSPQMSTGMMTYPAQGTLNRLIFKLPLVFWRMGLGPLVGKFMLVLTTRGRNTGLPRHTMVSFVRLDGRYYILSGWGTRAQWYRNIQANPRVSVQTGQITFSALARRVEDMDEYTRVIAYMLENDGDLYFQPWLNSLGITANLDDLVNKQARVYLMALDPTIQPGPAPLEKDLLWLWPVFALIFSAGWLLGRLSD